MNRENTASFPSFKKTHLSKLWASAIRNLLGGIQHGRLTIVLPNGEVMNFGSNSQSILQANITIKSYKAISEFFLKGELAFAEAYMNGLWESSNLTDLFDVILKNESAFESYGHGNLVSKTINRLRHLLNANSKRGSVKNIEFHYDLGNAFYEQWLDDTMSYSSGLFLNKSESLLTSQLNKYRAIADMAEIKAGENVLEIGCGWGGFSEIAAKEYGANIHGLTLSKEQYKYSTERYQREGINDRASASLTDYRDSSGKYDKIVSIEMFEAVGQENWNTYFDTVKARLEPGGIALLQVILIEDCRFEGYSRNVDFIQRYIFPGGLLPSRQALHESIEANGLTLEDDMLFGPSYAKTCQIWQLAFQHNWGAIKALGFDERFKKMWEYYLSYCEAGFNNGSIDVGLFKIRKPS